MRRSLRASKKVLHPGEEEAVMGAYYPDGTYMTKQEFEARKCSGANSWPPRVSKPGGGP